MSYKKYKYKSCKGYIRLPSDLLDVTSTGSGILQAVLQSCAPEDLVSTGTASYQG